MTMTAVLGQGHNPSPTPSAYSSAIPLTSRLRLRIRPHAPLPTEPFLLPIQIQQYPPGHQNSADHDDLSFLAQRIVASVPQEVPERSKPMDLAMYLDGFRLTGWDTKLGDLVRDGDVIDVYHVTRLPSRSHQGARKASHRSGSKGEGHKRKRRTQSIDSYHSEQSESSSVSSNRSCNGQKHKKARHDRHADHALSRDRIHREPSSSSSRLRQPASAGVDDVQAEADRISLLIKSEIGGSKDAFTGVTGGAALSRLSGNISDDELPSPPPQLASAPPVSTGVSLSADIGGLPVMSLPSSAAAAAMAAFEVRKKQAQSEQRRKKSGDTEVDENSRAASTSDSLVPRAMVDSSHPDAVAIANGDNGLEQLITSRSGDDHSSTLLHNPTGYEPSSSSSSPQSKSGTKAALLPSTCTDSISNATAPSEASKNPPPSASSTKEKLLSAPAITVNPRQTTPPGGWVPPGQGDSRTKRRNQKRRQKDKEKMKKTLEKLFRETQERVRRRLYGETNEVQDTEVLVEQVQEDPQESGPSAKSTTLPSHKAEAQATEAAPPREEDPPAATILPDEPIEDGSNHDGGDSTLGWSIDVTPTTPLIPYRDPTTPFRPPSALLNHASVRQELARREREVAELKESIRRAELNRRNVPPGGGMLDLDLTSAEQPAVPLANIEVPTANTQALPTSSVPQRAVSQAVTQPKIPVRSIATRPVCEPEATVEKNGPQSTKSGSKHVGIALALPPAPSTLPASSIPPNIQLTSVDCKAWYDGEDASVYLYMPPGQEWKRHAYKQGGKLQASEVTEDDGASAYLSMRRAVRESLRREKELEERQTAPPLVGVEENGGIEVHQTDLPAAFSSSKKKTSARAPEQLVQNVTAAPVPLSNTSVTGGSAPANIVALASANDLPLQFGTEKTRAKQQSGKSGRRASDSDASTRTYKTAISLNAPSSSGAIEVAFLGPPGTYSHQVALKFDFSSLVTSPANGIGGASQGQQKEGMTLVACSTITNALERAISATQNTSPSGTHHLALLPFANSTFGPVKETTSLLDKYNGRINVLTETELKVQHSLLVSQATYKALQASGDIISSSVMQSVIVKETAFAKIKKVFSHEQAIGQCDQFLKKNLPLTSNSGGRISVASTALAASMVASAGRSGANFEAAIASEICATESVIPGLALLKRGVQDKDDNTTRFLVVEPKVAQEANGLVQFSETKHKDKSLPSVAQQKSVPIAPASTSTKKPAHPDFFPGTSSTPQTDQAGVPGAWPNDETCGLDYGEPEEEYRPPPPVAGRASSRARSNHTVHANKMEMIFIPGAGEAGDHFAPLTRPSPRTATTTPAHRTGPTTSSGEAPTKPSTTSTLSSALDELALAREKALASFRQKKKKVT